MSASDSEWIFVVPKSRRARGRAQRGLKSNSNKLHTSNPGPRTEGLRSAEEIRAEYHRIRSQWDSSETALKLRELVDRQKRPISCAVCLGIGTFDPPDSGWETKRKTYIQFIAFLVMVEELEKSNENKIPCFFQEPIFSSSDKAFLRSLGHTVVESPDGFAKVTLDCLLFAVHLYKPIYAMALENNLPGIFIGTGWDVWDSVSLGTSTSDLDEMHKMEQTYIKALFPEEPSCTAFTSTSIYWKPAQPVLAAIPADTDKSSDHVIQPSFKRDHVDEDGLTAKLQATLS